jgi:DNA repair exonuclease SbcCD ATPase subunit
MLRLQRFRHEEKRQQVADIELMIADFNRKLGELDQQIEIEEERTGVSDPSHYNYSMTAKSIRGRRDNLQKSISELDAQLKDAEAQAEEAESELRKVELLVEKEGGPAMPDVDVEVPDSTVHAAR